MRWGMMVPLNPHYENLLNPAIDPTFLVVTVIVLVCYFFLLSLRVHDLNYQEGNLGCYFNHLLAAIGIRRLLDYREP